ncbi:NUDIX domain-containing protein [Aeromicrobium halocynthiae]|uniref:NUDIX domain-containing protein n=1 Tax=Aeromicrobium halocynthiae TaxID=560557 RepID=A0ABN2W123_9ACTN
MVDLSRFPRPNVAVDVAVLSVVPRTREATDRALAVLALERREEPAGLALPGRFMRPGERAADTLSTALREKADVDLAGREPELIGVFDADERDPRGWTVSLGHAVVLPTTTTSGRWVPVDELPRLLFDHTALVRDAVARTRARYELRPDPDGLMTQAFTLAELRQLHEAVLGASLQRDTFRRRMEPLLVPHVDDGVHTSRSSGGRPARLWTVAPTDALPERVRLPRTRR